MSATMGSVSNGKIKALGHLTSGDQQGGVYDPSSNRNGIVLVIVSLSVRIFRF